jgi:creatine kinase/arginine kinase
LNKPVWDSLKDATDRHGFSFKQAIFSGCQNTDSGIGVYAGSPDSYFDFADLFSPIIEDYHGYDMSNLHVSNMDPNDLDAPALPAEDAAFIVSTRIRVGRNLQDFPLGPGISRDQRREIEQLVVKACNSFQGELAGKYYSLSTMSAADQKQLIEDHFLFKEGDRFLEACGLNRDWPEGRGIYHNNDKTFLVWVNEEDQLRIISMQQGADIGAVFSRLSKACAIFESIAKFARNDRLGYITSCPTNLGTALRASVHIKLPNLGVRMDEFKAIADKYYVQIRGIHGEHSESADHVYDISNRRRLGRSEVDLVQDMYNGVKAMIEREKELAPPKMPGDI